MASGDFYKCATLTVGGTRIYGLTSFTFEYGCEILFGRADCLLWPQQAAAVNHFARIGGESIDLGSFVQASGSSPTVGADVGTGGVVLAISKTSGGTITHTLNKAVRLPTSGEGGHDRLSSVRHLFEAAGTGGTEPTVTIAVSA